MLAELLAAGTSPIAARLICLATTAAESAACTVSSTRQVSQVPAITRHLLAPPHGLPFFHCWSMIGAMLATCADAASLAQHAASDDRLAQLPVTATQPHASRMPPGCVAALLRRYNFRHPAAITTQGQPQPPAAQFRFSLRFPKPLPSRLRPCS